MLTNSLVKEKTKIKIIVYYLTYSSTLQNLKDIAKAALRGKFRELKVFIITQVLDIFT